MQQPNHLTDEYKQGVEESVAGIIENLRQINITLESFGEESQDALKTMM